MSDVTLTRRGVKYFFPPSRALTPSVGTVWTPSHFQPRRQINQASSISPFCSHALASLSRASHLTFPGDSPASAPRISTAI